MEKEQLHILLSAEDKQILRKEAAESGISMGAFVASTLSECFTYVVHFDGYSKIGKSTQPMKRVKDFKAKGGVPAYIIEGDIEATLLARYPSANITGFGVGKTELRNVNDDDLLNFLQESGAKFSTFFDGYGPNKYHHVVVRVSETEYKKLEELAYERCMSVSALVLLATKDKYLSGAI